MWNNMLAINQLAMWGLAAAWNSGLHRLSTFTTLGRAEHREKQTLSVMDHLQYPLAFPEYRHFSLFFISHWNYITSVGEFPEQLFSEPK